MIRRMNEDDVPTVHALGTNCSAFDISRDASAFWTQDVLKAWCNSPSDIALVVEVGEVVVGFALVAHHVPTGKATLENLFACETHRRTGIGATLLRQVIQEVRALKCSVLVALVEPSNSAIARTLERAGFHQQHQHHWYDLVP